MKCVYDATINLKNLVVKNSSKLATPIQGKSLLSHQFSTMKANSVASLFVLIEQDSPERNAISREAFAHGFTPNFIEVEPEIIARRLSVTEVARYLKEPFIYWPANRLCSKQGLQQLIAEESTNHQLVALVDGGVTHPHFEKTSVFKVVSKDAKSAPTSKDGAETKDAAVKPKNIGHDIGIYKCGAIVFQLADKVAGKGAFSWHKLYNVLNRAGRYRPVILKDQNWLVIESNQDIGSVQRFQVSSDVERTQLNKIDQSMLGGLYESFLSMASETFVSQISRVTSFGFAILGLLLMSLGHWFALFWGTLSLLVGFLLLPLRRLSQQTENEDFVDKFGLSLFRSLVIVSLSINLWVVFGAGFWILWSTLLLGFEVYFIVKPAELKDEILEKATSSYFIHSVWLLGSIFTFYPTLILTLYSLLPLSISATKAFEQFKEYQRDKA